jgi:hypothetical protein
LFAKPATGTPLITDHPSPTLGELVFGNRLVILREEHVQFCGDPILVVATMEPAAPLPAFVGGTLDLFL